MYYKNLLWTLLLGTGLLASSAARAAQSESPVACDEAAEPVILVYGDHTTGCDINPSTDLDSFNFDGTDGDSIRILLRTTGGLDGRIELFDPDGVVIDNPSCEATFSGCSLTLNADLVKSGVYGIAISDARSAQTGSYTLQLERIPPVPPAQPVAYNEAVSDAITPSTDMDFFTFNVNAGNTVRVTVNTTGGLDGRLELWDPNGDVVVNTFCEATFSGCTETTTQTLTVPGTYVLGISDARVAQTGSYTLTINCIFGPCPLPPTRAECDIEMSQATYVDGETMTANVFRYANLTSSPVALEWKVWLGVPGLAPVPVLNLGADGSFVLPAGTDADLGPVPLLPVNAGLPRGQYEFSCRLLNPVTGRLLREDRNFFDVQ